MRRLWAAFRTFALQARRMSGLAASGCVLSTLIGRSARREVNVGSRGSSDVRFTLACGV